MHLKAVLAGAAALIVVVVGVLLLTRGSSFSTSAFDDIEEGDSRAAVIETLGDPDYVGPPNESNGIALELGSELLAWIEDDVEYFVTIFGNGEVEVKGSVECSDEVGIAC